MSDRLQEIRARLDAATPGPWIRQDWACGDIAVVPERQSKDPDRNFICACEGSWDDDIAFIAHAPDDIAWLLGALASEQAHAETLIERIDQLHLEITRLRFGKPTPDVAYDIAVRRGQDGDDD